MSSEVVLSIADLQVRARTVMGIANLLNVARLDVHSGETVGIVGESGAGKSILAQTIMRLLPGNVFVTRGTITLNGRDLLKIPAGEMASRVRGKQLTMIFQDPMASLNPVFTVRELIEGVIRVHNPRLSNKAVFDRAIEMMKMVRLSDPEMTINKYPHELSGGMRQRILIAMALCSGARFLISDEATRNLDVTIQAGVLRVLEDLRNELDLSGIFISNNVALAATISRRLGILYAGELVEIGMADEIIRDARHSYTRYFLASLPSPSKKGRPLPVASGRNPDPLHKPKGCLFAQRCDHCTDECRAETPPLHEVSPTHFVACYRGGDMA